MRPYLMVIALLTFSVTGAAERDGYPTASDEPTALALERYVHSFEHGAATVPEDLAPYAEYSANDPAGEFDVERAAQFIDGVAVKWGAKHGCVTCHTNGHYLMVPPKIFKDRPAAEVAQELGVTEDSIFGAKRRVLARLREILPLMEEVW